MYCPKCATQNIDDAQFCRACGANVSLVPQAMSGNLPAKSIFPPLAPMVEMENFNRRVRGKNNRPPSLERGVRHLFMGVGFLLVAISIALFGGRHGEDAWWYWMLIPAFSLFGGGVAEIIRSKQTTRTALPHEQSAAQFSSSAQMNEIPARQTAEMRPLASVTEGTTRHLGTDAARRQYATTGEKTNERN